MLLARAWTVQSEDFDFGFFFAYSEGEPEEMTVLSDAIMTIARNMTTTADDTGDAQTGVEEQQGRITQCAAAIPIKTCCP